MPPLPIRFFFHPSMRPKPRPWDGRARDITRVELKLDGWRATVVRDKYDLKVYDRRGLNRLDQLHPDLIARFAKLPAQTILDGELHVPGKPASDVPTYLKRKSELLLFQPFAAPFIAGEDHRDSEEWLTLDMQLELLGFRAPLLLREGMLDEEMLKLIACEMNVEGFVLKQRHWGGWWKVKPQQTVDLVVIDLKPGKGKHSGRWGALQCGVMRDKGLIEIASVGKGNDEMWRDLPKGELIGRVCEVLHEGVQSAGKLRFSSFSRWRDDKSILECDGAELK